MNRRRFFNLVGTSSLCLTAFPYILNSTSKVNKKFLIGKGNTSKFTKIKEHLLESETALQFTKMQKAAKIDGLHIELVSAFRSFLKQKQIFEYKYQKLKANGLNQLDAIQQITEYSSIPGTSRHHWGTDIDIILKTNQNATFKNVLQTKHFQENGIFFDLHQWMQENAANFGFYLAYTNDIERTGYKYEPWHYSYLPKSKQFLEEYANLDMAKTIHTEEIDGLQDLKIEFYQNYILKYVMGVNSVLK